MCGVHQRKGWWTVSDERLIDASPEFGAGYGAAMYEVWRRFPPPGLMREGLTEPELIRLIAFVESCLPSPNSAISLKGHHVTPQRLGNMAT